MGMIMEMPPAGRRMSMEVEFDLTVAVGLMEPVPCGPFVMEAVLVLEFVLALAFAFPVAAEPAVWTGFAFALVLVFVLAVLPLLFPLLAVGSARAPY